MQSHSNPDPYPNPAMLSREMLLSFLQSFLSPLLLYRVMMLESLVSCGTAPSCLHWQRTSCSGSSKVVLQCLIKSGGIPSLPGASPDAKLSIALFSYSFDGSESNSSMVGRHSVRSRAACGRHSVLSLE